MEKDENQIILVDKPAGMSSFAVVAKVRGYLKAQFGHKVKVGHTGTLDPFATGLLILLSGKNTKKSGDFLKKDKVYEATLKLGFTSTTGDPEGEIAAWTAGGTAGGTPAEPCEVGETAVAGPAFATVQSIIHSFIGAIPQKVPQYSAVKINGQRAYKLARAGKSFDTPTRTVTIYNIEILEYNFPTLKIRAHVSSGTYIRTLAEDIGEKLGTGAYLTELRRTKIADYSVADARPLADFVI